MLCDLWQPPAGLAPSGLAFIYLHGGAWHWMDKDIGTRSLFRHLTSQGHLVMDVAYRLCPEVDIHGMDVWEDHRYPDDPDVRGQFLEVNGDQLGTELLIAGSFDDDTHPAVTANGLSNQYLAVWQQTTATGERILGRFRDSGGTWRPEFEVAPDGLGRNEFPAVATHLAGYLITYSWRGWDPNARTDIYGRTWSPHGLWLPLVLRKY